MKLKKKISFLMVFTMIFSLLAGCQKTNQATPNQTPGATSASSEAKTKLNTDKKIQLQIMLTPQWKGIIDQTKPGADYGDFFKYAGERFSKMYPNVSFNVQVITGTERTAVLNSNIQAGTPPDLFFESTMAMTDYAYMGALVPLDELVDEQSKKDIPDNAFQPCRVANKLFFYPYAQSVGLLIVNSDYFKTAGLGSMLPAEGKVGNWTPKQFKDSLIALKNNVKDQGFYPLGFFSKNEQSDQYNNCYLRMFGGEMFNKDSSAVVINSPEGIKAITFLKELYDEKLTQPSPESAQSADTRDMFRNKKVAVAYNLTSHYTEIVADMQSGKLNKFGISLFTLPGEKPISFNMGYGLCAFDTGDKDKIAFAKEFIKFASSDPELVMSSATLAIPVRQSVVDKYKDSKPYISMISSVSPYFKDFAGGIPNYTGFRALLYPTIQVGMSGKKTPKQALDDFAKDATALIKQGNADSKLH